MHINKSHPIQGAMDNFDHTENTASGKDSAHDTVLVIFQNKDKSDGAKEKVMTSLSNYSRRRQFKEPLPCQKLEQSGLIKGTGEIPEDFSPTPFTTNQSLAEDINDNYFLWCRSRNSQKEDITQLPSFTALESALQKEPVFQVTTKSFIPILPYPATDMDSIFTTMLNFNDVLKQRNRTEGALWCDEGVYAIAKEIQLLKPDLFGKIFLGLGPFHMEKIVIACLGKYLSCVGIDLALIESEIYGKEVVGNKVMNGGHYVKGKDGMGIIAEAISALLFQRFTQEEMSYELQQLLDDYESVIQDIASYLENEDMDSFRHTWEQAKVIQQDLKKLFADWKTRSMYNENYQYWSLFLDEIYPIQRDLTHSIRQGEWVLFVDVVRRAIPLFFGFGCTNYARFAPLFLEDCLDVQRKSPDLYAHYVKGGWVMYFTSRVGRAVGFDIGLERAYNKPAKIAGGIIGMTAKKESVAQWNIVKHEKDLHVANLLDWCGFHDDKDSELDLHHEFNPNSARRNNDRVNKLLNYVNLIGNPFSFDSKLRNICSGSSVAGNVVEGILKCLDVGEASYQDYRQARLVTRDKMLHDTIPSNRNEITPKPLQQMLTAENTLQTKVIKSKRDIADALRFIDYARERSYDMQNLLKHEITSTSYFLVSETKQGHRLKKPDKSSLTREIVGKLPKQFQNVQGGADMVIIDFMAFIRKLPFKKLKLQTYGDLAATLMERIMSNAVGSSRIDIIFDVYQQNSIKDGERAARAAAQGITISIKKDIQSLPVDMTLFWDSMENKIQLQRYFMTWMIRNCNYAKEIYFGGVDGMYCTKLTAGKTRECPELLSIQEEADDRILFHINHGYLNGIKSVSVVSPDADIFICLLCHFQKTWRLNELFMKLGRGKTRKTVPLHLLAQKLDAVLLESLPAIHALSGCDTTSKVGPKLACLKKPLNLELLEGFGVAPLSDDMVSKAETFLLESLTKTRDVSTFDQYRYEQYHDLGVMDFNNLVCCSSTIKEHIKRAYYQCMRWHTAPNPPNEFPDPTDNYGYKVTLDNKLRPIIIPGDSRPKGLPDPCKCKTCVKKTCVCHQAQLACSKFCKCSTGRDTANSDNLCKNPLNKVSTGKNTQKKRD